MTLWQILTSSKQEISSNFPCSRRFFQSGFELDPKNHDDNKLGLISNNMIIQLDLTSGDITRVH